MFKNEWKTYDFAYAPCKTKFTSEQGQEQEF